MDLINRRAAIDAIERRLEEPQYQHDGEDWYVGMICAEDEIYDLPSQPNRDTIDTLLYNLLHYFSDCVGPESFVPQKDIIKQLYEEIFGEGERPKWMI